MAQFRHSILSGGKYSAGSFVKGLLNPGGNGLVRMSLTSVGWDKVYNGLRNIPPSVQISIAAAMRKNSGNVADVARENAPEDTGALRESIQDVPTDNPLMRTVEANTPYAYFVEDDIHTSYLRNGPPPPSVFGDSPGQGDPQGAHYMARAIADTETASSAAMDVALQNGILKAIAMASRTYQGGLDVRGSRAAGAFDFLKSVNSVGVGIPSASGVRTEISPLDMALRGIE